MYNYYYKILCKFFTESSADGLSLEREWQQVSWRLQNSFQYSGRSLQWYSLDGFDLSSDFFRPPFDAFRDRSKRINYNWYIIIIILLLWEIFRPNLAEGLPLEFEWQQVSSNVQDLSQYSWRS